MSLTCILANRQPSNITVADVPSALHPLPHLIQFFSLHEKGRGFDHHDFRRSDILIFAKMHSMLTSPFLGF